MKDVVKQPSENAEEGEDDDEDVKKKKNQQRYKIRELVSRRQSATEYKNTVAIK